MFILIGIIVIIKTINIISGFVVQKKIVTVHSVMNKITGVLLFVLPLTVKFIDLRYSAAIVCAVAVFAAIQEGHYIRTGNGTLNLKWSRSQIPWHDPAEKSETDQGRRNHGIQDKAGRHRGL